MKILLITSTYPTPVCPRQGAFNRVLVDALRDKHDVRVIAPVPWTQLAWTPSKWPRCKAECLEQYPVYFYPPRILREHYHWFYWQAIRSSIARLGAIFEPDIVMGYWLHPDGAAAVQAARHFGVPAVVMSGGTDLRLLTRNPSRRRAILSVIQSANRLVVFSRELAKQALSYGIDPEKVDVIYRGVNRQCFYPSDKATARASCEITSDEVMIFWAGRWENVKNPRMLLEAAVQWKQTWNERLRVVVAGDGPLRNQLHRLRQQWQLEDSVDFVGNLSQNDLARYYNAADVTVLTSHSEGIPNVLLESIACGTPFVATDVGGVSEIASPGVDRLIRAGDVTALAEAVKDSIGTPKQSQRIFIPSDVVDMAERFQAVFAACQPSPQGCPQDRLAVKPSPQPAAAPSRF